jgi:hypothetical protein
LVLFVPSIDEPAHAGWTSGVHDLLLISAADIDLPCRLRSMLLRESLDRHNSVDNEAEAFWESWNP